jgi:hypothetical protein
MPDNVTVGVNTVAADELLTVNDVPQVEPLPKAERIKIGHGVDGDFTDASASDPFPTTDADVLAKLDALLTELQGKLEAGQVVALDTASLAALESITATIAGPVTLDAATLAALETIQVGNLPGAAAAVSYGTGTGNQTAPAGADVAGRLIGYAVRETTGTPGATAQVRFRSGTTVSGTPLGAGVTLAANESVREWFGPSGINVPTAVFLERVSGSTEVTVYYVAGA